MNLKNYYWYFKSVIPEHICDDIVKYGHQLQDQTAVTGGYNNKKINTNQLKDLNFKIYFPYFTAVKSTYLYC